MSIRSLELEKLSSFSTILAGFQGGFGNCVGGPVETRIVEKVFGQGFSAYRGQGYVVSFRRFEDNPEMGRLSFRRKDN